MVQNYDAIVIGMGIVGSSAAWQLARSGQNVLALEQFELDHHLGSSYGSSRIIRYAYDHPAYIPLARAAYPLWRELEEEAGETLLIPCGGLDFGQADEPLLLATRDTMRVAGIPCDWLTPAETTQRFPQFRLDDGMMALYQADAGCLLASKCVHAATRMALESGARIVTGARVSAIEAGRDDVHVRAGSEDYHAARLVLCAGSWSRPLLCLLGLELPLTPTREQLVFVEPSDAQRFHPSECPVFIKRSKPWFYGLPDVDGCGLKSGIHNTREAIDPDRVKREVDDTAIGSVRAFLRRHLPLADGPVKATRVCLYTMTPDEHFILDRHPAHPHIAIGAGFSGHGFKFGVLSGKILAQLVSEGHCEQDINLFALDRF